MPSPLRIGISANFFHSDPTRPLFKGKTLLYLEQSLGHWLLSEGVLAFLVPTLAPDSPLTLGDLVSDLDGLLLQGGADVAPATYGEREIRPEWAGDPVRDQYEIALVQETLKQKKPILGICRGAQLLNVALGGTLYQDIQTQLPKANVHRHWEVYDQLFHKIAFESGSLLEKLYPARRQAKVNSLHHQAIKSLGNGLHVEARSEEDDVVEAVRFEGNSFAYAFQWHPEFHDPRDTSLLDGRPILKTFISEALKRRLVNE